MHIKTDDIINGTISFVPTDPIVIDDIDSIRIIGPNINIEIPIIDKPQIINTQAITIIGIQIDSIIADVITGGMTDDIHILINPISGQNIPGTISFVHPNGGKITIDTIINPIKRNTCIAMASNIKENLGSPATAGGRI